MSALWPVTLGVGSAAVATGMALHFQSFFNPRSRLLGPHTWRLPADAQPRLALTFDDGPHPEATPAVLELLDRHHAPATFFMVGRYAQEHPGVVEQVHRAGHLIGNHSHTHPHMGIVRGGRFWTREITAAGDAIQGVIGRRPAWFRPPLGHRNLRQMAAARRLGYHVVTWSCRSRDGLATDPDAVVARALEQTEPGAIVLMHDGVNHRRHRDWRVTVAALERLLPRWADLGFDIVPLDRAIEHQPYHDAT